MAVHLKDFEQVKNTLWGIRPYLPVGLTLLVGLSLSAIAATGVYEWERRSAQDNLMRRRDSVTLTLQSDIDEYLQVTRSLGALYDISGQVTEENFQRFSQSFLENYPGIFGMAWIERVPRSQRRAFEQRMRAQGKENFQIRDRAPDGTLVPAGDRPEYFPILYGQPASRYTGAMLGLDPGYDPRVRAEITLGKHEGRISLTERFLLGDGKTYGVAMFRPVYRGGDRPTGIGDRRHTFKGMTYTVYSLSNLLERSLGGLTLNNLDFYLLDRAAEPDHQVLIFYDSQTQQFIADSRLTSPAPLSPKSLCYNNPTLCTQTLQIANRQWTLVLRPTSTFQGFMADTIATLTIGLLLTGIITIYLGLSIRRTRDLEAAMQQLQTTQGQLIQAEKMSSIGQLVAGVAHEINNPVSFIYGNVNHADEYVKDLLFLLALYQQHYPEPVAEIQEESEALDVEFIIEDLPKTIKSMSVGAERIQNIVLSLRNFSRTDEAEIKPVDIHQGLNSTLMILQHRLKATAGHQAIQVVKKYGELPLVECYPGQLNQVFMNLLANAIDALEDTLTQPLSKDYIPTLNLCTEVLQKSPAETPIEGTSVNPKSVVIWIEDNGNGIPPEILPNIFNPFFTTKPIGKGTGLGLSISYQIIVEKHLGKLNCFSTRGKGTEFRIEIPVSQTGQTPPS
ncbi:CHASE domain-containing protein [Oscillatoria acuminata]|uniref:histidine kinase n=1 Tax=Oscillatoria acuminata PCC 6304 TaxID=56110 RepID=K9TIK7_9CYAN|nr:CHASE domain-containing protein [Oscillatoria acuminata]AFY81986.1 signal transduction histidine kinase [Oscillatoria acuminata PCC 6304]